MMFLLAFITRCFKFVLCCLCLIGRFIMFFFQVLDLVLCSVCLLSDVLCLYLVFITLPEQRFKLCYLYQLLYVLCVCYQVYDVCGVYVNYQNFDICALYVYQHRLMFVLCVCITRCLTYLC